MKRAAHLPRSWCSEAPTPSSHPPFARQAQAAEQVEAGRAAAQREATAAAERAHSAALAAAAEETAQLRRQMHASAAADEAVRSAKPGLGSPHTTDAPL